MKLSGVILKGKKGCRHRKANGQARSRVAAKAAKRRKFTPEMWDYAITHLRDDGWTFEQSCGRARRDGIPMVCVETLYQEYYRRQDLVRRGAVEGRPSPLPRCQKKRKTRNRDAKKHRNGVVRKILPKGSPFDAILDEEMRRIDRMLNDRPLKCLDWRTPREAFTALLHRYLLAAD